MIRSVQLKNKTKQNLKDYITLLGNREEVSLLSRIKVHSCSMNIVPDLLKIAELH